MRSKVHPVRSLGAEDAEASLTPGGTGEMESRQMSTSSSTSARCRDRRSSRQLPSHASASGKANRKNARRSSVSTVECQTLRSVYELFGSTLRPDPCELTMTMTVLLSHSSGGGFPMYPMMIGALRTTRQYQELVICKLDMCLMQLVTELGKASKSGANR